MPGWVQPFLHARLQFTVKNLTPSLGFRTIFLCLIISKFLLKARSEGKKMRIVSKWKGSKGDSEGEVVATV